MLAGPPARSGCTSLLAVLLAPPRSHPTQVLRLLPLHQGGLAGAGGSEELGEVFPLHLREGVRCCLRGCRACGRVQLPKARRARALPGGPLRLPGWRPAEATTPAVLQAGGKAPSRQMAPVCSHWLESCRMAPRRYLRKHGAAPRHQCWPAQTESEELQGCTRDQHWQSDADFRKAPPRPASPESLLRCTRPRGCSRRLRLGIILFPFGVLLSLLQPPASQYCTPPPPSVSRTKDRLRLA